MCTFSISLTKTESGIRIIPMMDAVYDALQMELADQKENGFNETEIDGMKGFIFMNHAEVTDTKKQEAIQNLAHN